MKTRWSWFILFPLTYLAGLDVNPLNAIVNGNIIVFVTVLSAASLGLFLEMKRVTSWHIGTRYFVYLLLTFMFAAFCLPLFLFKQVGESSQIATYSFSLILLIIGVRLARNVYLMTLLDQEPLNEEEERKAELSFEEAKKKEKIGNIEV